MRRTEAWWTCAKCGTHVAKLGKNVKEKTTEHLKTCGEGAGFRIQQVTQERKSA